jgi:chromosomal replication initiator protein
VQAAGVANGILSLKVPNSYLREWILREYLSQLEETAVALGSPVRIQIDVDPTLDASGSGAPAQVDGFEGEVNLNSNFVFDQFIAGPSSELAYSAAIQVAGAPGEHFNPLYVCGGEGLGKTHLLQAICHQLSVNGHGRRITYAPCDSFVNQFLVALDRGRLEAFRRVSRRADVLIIDDIHFLGKTEHSQEEFFYTFNALQSSQKQIVVSADVEPDQLPGIEPRLISRFKSGLVVRIDAPDYDTRVRIIQQKSRALNSRLPDDVVRYIASNRSSGVRELEGAVIRIIGYASLLSSPITLAVARNALVNPTAKPIGMPQILNCIASYFNISSDDILSQRRSRSIAIPRQICMYLARDMTHLSLNEIGQSLGNRDHSTILHGISNITHKCESDSNFSQTLSRLRQAIESKR